MGEKKISNKESEKEKISKQMPSQNKGHALDEELPYNSDSEEDDPSSIWGHRFEKADSDDEQKATDAKKLGTDNKDAKDATMKKSEATYDIHDPRNTINKRRREMSSKKGNKKARVLASKFGQAI